MKGIDGWKISLEMLTDAPSLAMDIAEKADFVTMRQKPTDWFVEFCKRNNTRIIKDGNK